MELYNNSKVDFMDFNNVKKFLGDNFTYITYIILSSIIVLIWISFLWLYFYLHPWQEIANYLTMGTALAAFTGTIISIIFTEKRTKKQLDKQEEHLTKQLRFEREEEAYIYLYELIFKKIRSFGLQYYFYMDNIIEKIDNLNAAYEVACSDLDEVNLTTITHGARFLRVYNQTNEIFDILDKIVELRVCINYKLVELREDISKFIYYNEETMSKIISYTSKINHDNNNAFTKYDYGKYIGRRLGNIYLSSNKIVNYRNNGENILIMNFSDLKYDTYSNITIEKIESRIDLLKKIKNQEINYEIGYTLEKIYDLSKNHFDNQIPSILGDSDT